MEEEYFEQKEVADSFNDEIIWLSDIWQESRKLWERSISGQCTLSSQERWDLIGEMTECIEHSRLISIPRSRYGYILRPGSGLVERGRRADLAPLQSQQASQHARTGKGIVQVKADRDAA